MSRCHLSFLNVAKSCTILVPVKDNSTRDIMNNSMCTNLGLAVALPDSLTSTDTTVHMAAALLLIPLSAFTVAANLVIIVSLVLSHLQNISHGCAINASIVRTLIVSMAVSDAIIGCFSMPLAIYELFMSGHWALGRILCVIKQSLDVFLCTVSIYHVTCMAVDRYLAVCKPLTYRTLSIKTGYSMIVVSWSVPAALSVIPFLGDWHIQGFQDIVTCFQINSYCSIIFNLPYQVTSALISFYIPMVTVCVLYFLIARKVWLVSKTFSSETFRNSFWSLRRNFYSLSKRQRQPRTSTTSLGEINRNLSGKEADRQLKNTTSHVMSSSSQTAHLNKVQASYKQWDGTKCYLEEQEQPQQQRQHRQHRQQQRQRQQKDFLTIPGSFLVADKVEISNSSSTIYHLASIQPGMCGDGRDASFHSQCSRSLMELSSKHTALELGVTKSASVDCILSTRAQAKQTLPLSSYLATYSRHRTKRRSRSGFDKMKAVKTIGSVVVCFMLCWMPFSIYIIIQSYQKYALPMWPYVILTWLGYLNSALNPILYCGNKSIRETVRSFIFPAKMKPLNHLNNGPSNPPINAGSTDYKPPCVDFGSGLHSRPFGDSGQILNVELPVEIINSHQMMRRLLQSPVKERETDVSPN